MPIFDERIQQLDEDLKHAARLLTQVPDIECRTELQSLKLQSYIFLTHSIFEHFIEDIGTMTVDKSVDLYIEESKINKPFIALIACNIIDEQTKTKRLEAKDKIVRDLVQAGKDAKMIYGHIIQSNDGIKSGNQKNVLIPAGIDPQYVDISAYNAMNTYGIQRGDIAHKFAVIRTGITKTATLSQVDVIVAGLKAFAAEIEVAFEAAIAP